MLSSGYRGELNDGSPPGIDYSILMASCKFCDEEIAWTQRGERWIPLNYGSGVQHKCQSAARSDDPYRVLFLRPDAPPEVIKAVYRVLAVRYHPDKGGDLGAMTRLNVAYQKIVSGD